MSKPPEWGTSPLDGPRVALGPGTDSRGQPAAEHALGDIIRAQGEGQVVSPVTVDVEVALAQTLFTEAQLLHHPQRSGVADRLNLLLEQRPG